MINIDTWHINTRLDRVADYIRFGLKKTYHFGALFVPCSLTATAVTFIFVRHEDLFKRTSCRIKNQVQHQVRLSR